MNLTDDLKMRVEQTGEASVVYAAGEICLTGAAELQRLLTTTLEAGRPVVVDLAGATSIDLCGLQLLCSAHRTSRSGPDGFTLRAAPAELRNTARSAGYDARTSVCPFRGEGPCLWKD